MNCGSDLFHPDCVGATITLDNTGFQQFYGELVSTGTALFTIMLSAGTAEMPENLVRAMNAIRCAYVSGWVNQWMLMGAVYYASRQFGYDLIVGGIIQSWYPYVCTCTKDVETI